MTTRWLFLHCFWPAYGGRQSPFVQLAQLSRKLTNVAEMRR